MAATQAQLLACLNGKPSSDTPGHRALGKGGKFDGKAGSIIRNRKGATRRALNGARFYVPSEGEWNAVGLKLSDETGDLQDPFRRMTTNDAEWSEWTNARSQKAR